MPSSHIPSQPDSAIGQCLIISQTLELSLSSHEKHMLMGELIYTVLLTSENEGDSDARTSSMWLVSTLTLARHAELLLMDGIMQRKMETLLREDSTDRQQLMMEFLDHSQYGILSWMLALEKNFLSLCESWLLRISPDLILNFPSTLTSGMLHKTLSTRDQQETILASTMETILNLSSGCNSLMKSLMDNMVSMPPSLGPWRDHGGPSGGRRPPLARIRSAHGTLGRSRSLVLWGPSRSGKTTFARSVAEHVYFGGLFSARSALEHSRGGLYAVFDDIRGGIKFFPGFKDWLGCQPCFMVKQLYREPRLMAWGKPSIWVANKDPRDDLDTIDIEWMEANCIFCYVTNENPLFTPYLSCQYRLACGQKRKL